MSLLIYCDETVSVLSASIWRLNFHNVDSSGGITISVVMSCPFSHQPAACSLLPCNKARVHFRLHVLLD